MTNMMLQDHRPRIDRIGFDRAAPGVIAALRAPDRAVDDSGLDKSLTELINLRASQINSCAFCVSYHLNAARRLGVAPVKLDLVAAWCEAGVYTARERAAFAWTETLTLMAGQGAADAVYAELQAQFSQTGIAFPTAAIGVINAWNRIAGARQLTPPVPSEPSGRGASR